jgi:hypothetical protein
LPASILAVLLAGPATGAPDGSYAIGDSVMLGARSELIARGIRVNARMIRQFDDGVSLVRKLAQDDRLPRSVVVHLGHNGSLTAAECDALVRAAGTDRRVWLVTLKVPRSWQAANNRRLITCARRHERAHLIPWGAYSRHHRSWFYSDGFHLRPIGQRRYAAFIAGYV